MRYVLTIIVVLLAFPAWAQQGAVCKGKQSFTLGDGTSGCLLDIRATSITKTLTRDDGQSRSNSRNAALIEVAMFGRFNSQWRVSTPRMKEVCNIFRQTATASFPGKPPKSIVVRMLWPDVPNPERNAFVRLRSKVANQAAFMNGSCRSIKYFR
ncbi:hypothetical protein BWR18_04190 [Tateyamaria omphalii]|uniref:Uncharacterized protein n=1 Tax=Tateyamaria omphalii TaxID=299262 RepID=A0A1P8MSN8_9RHOB|nr:hypothetical protein BWR18_04190 [Tateyamaria omphalii]